MAARKTLVLNGSQIQNLQTTDWLVGPDGNEETLFQSSGNLYKLSLGTNVPSLSFASGANITLSGGGELLGLPNTPTDPNAAASKFYVDSLSAGFDPKASVRAATTGNLVAAYDNGTSGVGATLTASANGALSVDGLTAAVNDRILVWQQTDASENGIYVVTATGDGSNPYILTRATDQDGNPGAEVSGGNFTYVEAGSTYLGNGFVVIFDGLITVGSDNIVWSLAAGAGSSSITFAADTGSSTVNTGGTLTVTGGTAVSTTSAGGTVTIDVNVDNSTIEVSGDALQVKDAGITNAKLQNSSITLNANSGSGSVSLGGTITISGSNGVSASVSGGTFSLSLDTDLQALANTATTGIYVVTGSGTSATRTITGTTDRVTITNGDGVSGNPTIDIASTYVGQSSITTLGTITTGTWNADVIDITYGGTGGSTATEAFDNLSPTTTKGDLIVNDGTNNVRLPVGTDGQVLVANSGATEGAEWQTFNTENTTVAFTNDNAGSVVIGTPVYVKSNGNVDKAQADSSSTVVVIGLVTDASIATTASGNVAIDGIVTATTGEWDTITGDTGGLTPGAFYLLDPNTAGMLTTTAPTTSGDFVAVVGIAISSTKLKLHPQPTIQL